MRAAQAVAGLLFTAVVLAACGGGDHAAERRALVAELTQAANERDADRVRERAGLLMVTVTEHYEKGELSAEQAERLTLLAQRVEKGADVVDEDLQQRLEAEAAAEAARKELEETQRRLEEERRQAEEAARQAEADKDEGEDDKGKKGEDKDDD